MSVDWKRRFVLLLPMTLHDVSPGLRPAAAPSVAWSVADSMLSGALPPPPPDWGDIQAALAVADRLRCAREGPIGTQANAVIKHSVYYLELMQVSPLL